MVYFYSLKGNANDLSYKLLLRRKAFRKMLEEILSNGFNELGLNCDELMLSRFRQYYESLEQTNKVMNLTSISGEKNVAQLHFLDCAALLRYAQFERKKLIDVGTGAGFPGLALKIACPNADVTLLDSLDKRLGFLRSTCEEIGFGDVQFFHSRAEEIPKGLREHFDIATARAVASLNVLSEMCLPYVAEGGLFIAMKGPDFDEELESAKPAIKALGGKTEKCLTYTIPGTDIVHSAIMIRKVSSTPPLYPRSWAKIKKSPLK